MVCINRGLHRERLRLCQRWLACIVKFYTANSTDMGCLHLLDGVVKVGVLPSTYFVGFFRGRVLRTFKVEDKVPPR